MRHYEYKPYQRKPNADPVKSSWYIAKRKDPKVIAKQMAGFIRFIDKIEDEKIEILRTKEAKHKERMRAAWNRIHHKVRAGIPHDPFGHLYPETANLAHELCKKYEARGTPRFAAVGAAIHAAKCHTSAPDGVAMRKKWVILKSHRSIAKFMTKCVSNWREQQLEAMKPSQNVDTQSAAIERLGGI